MSTSSGRLGDGVHINLLSFIPVVLIWVILIRPFVRKRGWAAREAESCGGKHLINISRRVCRTAVEQA